MAKNLQSAIPPLTPTLVIEAKTGRIVSDSEWSNSVRELLSFIHGHVENTWKNDEEQLTQELKSNTRVKPAELGRRLGYNIMSVIPQAVLAKSRVERLYRHKLISETSSWVKLEQSNKGALVFNYKINLGAVDKQMSQVGYDAQKNEISLLWKCWDNEYLFLYQLPAYLTKRKILKITQPTIRITNKGSIVFEFVYEEPLKYRSKQKHNAGLDLGRVQPYTIMITNQSGKRVAHYTASKRLVEISRHREKLITLRKVILKKISRKKKLEVDYSSLTLEANRLRTKITNLAHNLKHEISNEIARKLEKHHIDTLHIEDLRWVTGQKHGGKWNHSAQQEIITHKLARKGIKTKRVNPRNTSQACYNCGEKISHNTKKRTVHCHTCKQALDRDINASWNISNMRHNKLTPVLKRGNGAIPSHSTRMLQDSRGTIPKSMLRKTKQQEWST